MELLIKNAMNDKLIKDAAILYDVDVKDIKYVGGFENFVYEYNKDDKDYILRFVHSLHRTYDLVLAELEFIDYLDKNGAKVSTVVHSATNSLVERINLDDEYYFTICVFTKAPGRRIIKEDLTNEYYQMLGKELGKLHRLTKSYKPIHKRQLWCEETYLEQSTKFLQKKDAKIIDIYHNLIDLIKNLPQNIDNFGLIHTDLHFGNMLIDGGELTFFDWDDSSYKHFISDIAIIIFYRFSFGDTPQDVINSESVRMIRNLMIGYGKENSLNMDEFKMLNEFFLLRTIILYIVIHAAGEEDFNSEWGKRYISKYRDRILNNIPFLDLEMVLKGIYGVH
ncbi:phosphotransferase [Candidatus Izimaplasma bacterium]|nr:phosphotransferase [Candidatus Izimaplasma bacterium]